MSAEPRGPWGTTRADERRYGYPPPRCSRTDPHPCALGRHSSHGAYLPEPVRPPAPRTVAVPHPVPPDVPPIAWCPVCRGFHRPIRGLR